MGASQNGDLAGHAASCQAADRATPDHHTARTLPRGVIGYARARDWITIKIVRRRHAWRTDGRAARRFVAARFRTEASFVGINESVRWLLLMTVLCLAPAIARAQFKDQKSDDSVALGKESTQRIRVGLVIKARGGAIYRVIGTAPVPTDWPEQRVKIVNEELSSTVNRLNYRDLTGGGGVKQMVIEIPQLAAGEEAKALVTFEVTRRAILAPTDTTIFSIPKKLDRLLQVDVGPSPYIESRHPKIIAAAREAVAMDEEA